MSNETCAEGISNTYGGTTSSVQGGQVEGAPTHKLKAEPRS